MQSNIMNTETAELKEKQTRPRLWAYKKLGFTKPEASELVDSMNKLLANYHVHYQKLRNYHWNVKGPDFFDVHEEFEELYNEAIKNIDKIAERIRVFGYTPMSTLKEYLEISEIKETGTDLESMAMVREILNDFEIILTYMADVADAAIDVGDIGTEDMINSFVKKMEKSHWMLSAFASED